MKVTDFLKVELLGNNFVAVKEYEPVTDYETGELKGYKLGVSIQDEGSDFYFEKITVGVKNSNPTLKVSDLKGNKTRPVVLKGLKMGVINDNIWFNCTDVLPKKLGGSESAMGGTTTPPMGEM